MLLGTVKAPDREAAAAAAHEEFRIAPYASASSFSGQATIPKRRRVLRRGEIIGERVDGEYRSEAEHFSQCPICGGYVDICDLAQCVPEGDGPLPHSAQDRVHQVVGSNKVDGIGYAAR